jgi:hypothetical protein
MSRIVNHVYADLDGELFCCLNLLAPLNVQSECAEGGTGPESGLALETICSI